MSLNAGRKIAVVTGGAGGIGAACAEVLARQGWRVVVCDLDGAAAAGVARRVGGVARALDIADRAAVDEAGRWVEAKVGPCAALVACAAYLENPHPPEEQLADEWQRIVDVNVGGTFHTCRAFGSSRWYRHRCR